MQPNGASISFMETENDGIEEQAKHKEATKKDEKRYVMEVEKVEKKRRSHRRHHGKSHTQEPSTPPPPRETGGKVGTWKEEMDEDSGERWWVCEETGARIMMRKTT